MSMRDDLLRLVDKYQELTGASESMVSNTLFRNGTKLPAFRRGERMDISVYERCIHWFTENWPKGHRKDWPSGVRKIFVCVAVKPASEFVKGSTEASADAE